MPADPTRFRIVGVSGSGKSRLAARAALRSGLPHLELDAVFWDADWTYRDLDEARERVRAFMTAHPDGWITDGNWTSRLDGLLELATPGGADLVVWLDHPRRVVMWRVVTRTLWRGLTRKELWHGNRENPRSWLRTDPHENIILWSWTQHAVVRERMLGRIAAGDPVLRLRRRRDVEAWIASLPRRSVDA